MGQNSPSVRVDDLPTTPVSPFSGAALPLFTLVMRSLFELPQFIRVHACHAYASSVTATHCPVCAQSLPGGQFVPLLFCCVSSAAA